jgi:hypothetical protein
MGPPDVCEGGAHVVFFGLQKLCYVPPLRVLRTAVVHAAGYPCDTDLSRMPATAWSDDDNCASSMEAAEPETLPGPTLGAKICCVLLSWLWLGITGALLVAGLASTGSISFADMDAVDWLQVFAPPAGWVLATCCCCCGCCLCQCSRESADDKRAWRRASINTCMRRSSIEVMQRASLVVTSPSAAVGAPALNMTRRVSNAAMQGTCNAGRRVSTTGRRISVALAPPLPGSARAARVRPDGSAGDQTMASVAPVPPARAAAPTPLPRRASA